MSPIRLALSGVSACSMVRSVLNAELCLPHRTDCHLPPSQRYIILVVWGERTHSLASGLSQMLKVKSHECQKGKSSLLRIKSPSRLQG